MRSAIATRVEQLQANAAEFAELVAAFPRATLLEPFGDEFSVVEHACHLRDLERDGFTPRLRSIIETDDPLLHNFDGAAVAAASAYRAQNAADALDVFLDARRKNVDRLLARSEADFSRIGHYEFAPPITLEAVVAGMLDHDRDHLERVRALRSRAGG